MQFLQKTEDARVHYAVLKIRTEPCLRAPHPGGPSAGRSSQRPPKAAASSGPNSVLRIPAFTRPRSAAPRGESVLTGQFQQGNRIASAPLESMDAQSRIR